jgi:hypothetical protein
VNEDGILALAGNTSFVVTIDGDATRDGTRITIQEKKDYNEKQKCKSPVPPFSSRYSKHLVYALTTMGSQD